MKRRALNFVALMILFSMVISCCVAADENTIKRDVSRHEYFFVTYPEEDFTYNEDYDRLKNSQGTGMTFDPMLGSDNYNELKATYEEKYSSYDNYKLEETEINGCTAMIMQYEDWLGGYVQVVISFGDDTVQSSGGSKVFGMRIAISGNNLDDCYDESLWDVIRSFEIEGRKATSEPETTVPETTQPETTQPETTVQATTEPVTEEVTTIPEPEVPVYTLGEKQLVFNPQFTDEDTRAMGSFMNYGLAVVVDDCIYASSGVYSHPVLKRTIDQKTYPDINMGDKIFIGPEGLEPYMFTYSDGYVYFIANCYGTSEYSGIFRINVKNDEFETIYDGSVASYMQIYDGNIYFCDADYHYCCVDTNGENYRVIIGDKEVYFPYQIGDGFVVFQDDADGEKLHLFHEDGLDLAITSKRSYQPVLAGDYIYFIAKDAGSNDGYFGRLNIRTMTEEYGENYIQYFFIDRDKIYSPDNPVLSIDDWKNLKNEKEMNYSYSYVVFADGKYQLTNSFNGDKFKNRDVWGMDSDGIRYYMGTNILAGGDAKPAETETETETTTAAAAHVHSWQVAAGGKSATCTENGIILYSCSGCGEQTSETIPATGHNMVRDNGGNPPSCTSDGAKYYHCTYCGATYTEVLPAVGHDMQYSYSVTRTCLISGYDVYKCSRCPYEEDANFDPAQGHHMELVYETDSTCTYQGQVTYQCRDCTEIETNYKPYALHEFVYVTSMPATCIEPAYYYYQCTHCSCDEYQYYGELAPHYYIWTFPCYEPGYMDYHINICSGCGDGDWSSLKLHIGNPCSVCGYSY